MGRMFLMAARNATHEYIPDFRTVSEGMFPEGYIQHPV